MEVKSPSVMTMSLLTLPNDLLFKELFPHLSTNELLPLRRSSSEGRRVVDSYQQWDLSRLWIYYDYLMSYPSKEVGCRYGCPFCPRYKIMSYDDIKIGPHRIHGIGLRDELYCPCPFCGIKLSPFAVGSYFYEKLQVALRDRQSGPEYNGILRELLQLSYH